MADHYKSILRDKFPASTGYAAEKISDKWLGLKPLDRDSFDKGPWKFHLSVHGDDAPKAWNIIVDTLLADKECTHRAKVASPTALKKVFNPSADTETFTGKTITLYANYKSTPQHFQQLLSDIEAKLAAAHIRPGLDVPVDRKVPGAQYTSYVYDRHDSSSRKTYKPDDEPDPFIDFAIQPRSMNEKASKPSLISRLAALLN